MDGRRVCEIPLQDWSSRLVKFFVYGGRVCRLNLFIGFLIDQGTFMRNFSFLSSFCCLLVEIGKCKTSVVLVSRNVFNRRIRRLSAIGCWKYIWKISLLHLNSCNRYDRWKFRFNRTIEPILTLRKAQRFSFYIYFGWSTILSSDQK